MIGFGFLGMLLFWGALFAFLVGGAALVLRQMVGWGYEQDESHMSCQEVHHA